MRLVSGLLMCLRQRVLLPDNTHTRTHACTRTHTHTHTHTHNNNSSSSSSSSSNNNNTHYFPRTCAWCTPRLLGTASGTMRGYSAVWGQAARQARLQHERSAPSPPYLSEGRTRAMKPFTVEDEGQTDARWGGEKSAAPAPPFSVGGEDGRGS